MRFDAGFDVRSGVPYSGTPSSLRYAQVQALKFLQTRATPPAARRATRRRKVARAVAGRGGS